MAKQHKVVLLGNSVFIAGMQVTLRGQPGLEVTRLNAADANMVEHLNVACPEVIIFDLAMPQSGALFDLFTRCQKACLIGLDLNQNVTIVLSGQPQPVLSADDLIQVIQYCISPRRR